MTRYQNNVYTQALICKLNNAKRSNMDSKTKLPQNRIAQIPEERKEHIKGVFYKDLEVVMMEIQKHINYMDKKYMCISRQKIIQQIQAFHDKIYKNDDQYLFAFLRVLRCLRVPKKIKILAPNSYQEIGRAHV